jgi:molybdopterin converting factor small subunit
MKFRIQLFAIASQLADSDSLELDLPPGATVAELRARLVEQVPSLAPVARHLLFAIDAKYADDQVEITPGADIACIPPVSGG